jgi:hypothetical protein
MARMVFGVRRHVAALKARTCPRTPNRIQFALIRVIRGRPLLVAQRFDGIERGGLTGWVKSEENPNGCAEQKCDSN